MKIYLTLLLFVFSNYCFSQEITIKEILENSDNCIRKINTISYWIDFEMKYLSREDTMTRRSICHLKSAPNDSLNVYHNFVSLMGNHQQVYNGDNILNVNFKDSSSLIINTELYGYGFIKGNTNRELIRYNLFEDSLFLMKLSDTSMMETILEETVFENREVYSVLFKYKDSDQVSNLQSTYFIRKSDFFPIGYKQTLNFQNMLQYKSYSLSNISVNPFFDDRLFDIDYNIIDKAKTKNYVPKEREPLLSNGYNAPEINKKTILGKDFRLSDYKGKIVILDFWYRSCYPCIKALPDLQKISSETDSNEIIIIGVNPFDKKEKIISFLDERDINYTNIYESKSVATDYKVSAYPTLYIIDREGNIHSSHVGWSEEFYNDIMKEIKAIK